MSEKSSARHAHQQYLTELSRRLDRLEISPAEFTTLCLIPDLARKAQPFQKNALVRGESARSSTIEFLRQHSWKGYSDRIRRSLYEWHQGRYPLTLWSTIPSPLQLLEIQSQGQRVITVFKTALEWEQTHLGKSAWEFVVHDLIHADHFFENPIWREGQIGFYRFILEHWDHELMTNLKTHCPEQFDYLIADMNSHPQHMYQTLSALSLLAWKRKMGLRDRDRLLQSEEQKFQNQFHDFLETRLFK